MSDYKHFLLMAVGMFVVLVLELGLVIQRGMNAALLASCGMATAGFVACLMMAMYLKRRERENNDTL